MSSECTIQGMDGEKKTKHPEKQEQKFHNAKKQMNEHSEVSQALDLKIPVVFFGKRHLWVQIIEEDVPLHLAGSTTYACSFEP